MSNDDLSIDGENFRRLQAKGRYVVLKSGYVIDRNPVRLVILVFLAVALIIVGGDYMRGEALHAWAYCPPDALGGGCDNPLYQKCNLPACQQETLRPGEEIGEPPQDTATTYTVLFFMGLLCAFLYNHGLQKSKEYENARNSYNKPKRKGKRRSRS